MIREHFDHAGILGHRHDPVGAAGIGHQRGFGAGAEGEQVAHFLGGPLQPRRLDVLCLHTWGDFNRDGQCRLIRGKRRELVLPGRPGQGDDGDQPASEQQCTGRTLRCCCVANEQVVEKMRVDDVLPWTLSI